MNSELSGEWEVEVISHSLEELPDKTGKNKHYALVQVNVTVLGKTMSAFASHPVLDDVGDAFKSAQTDAMKKALSHFSIGNRAYHGLLPNNK